MTIKTNLKILPKNAKLSAFSLLIVSLLSSAFLQAGLYRWVDENGTVHFGDRIPAKYAKIEREVYSSQGVVINVLPAEKTKEQLVSEELQRQLKIEQDRLTRLADLRDKTLLASYNDVGDIEHARDTKLAQINTQIDLLDLNLVNLTQQKENLGARISIVENGNALDKEDILTRFNKQKIDNEIAQNDIAAKRGTLKVETYKITAFYAKEASDFTLLKMQKDTKIQEGF